MKYSTITLCCIFLLMGCEKTKEKTQGESKTDDCIYKITFISRDNDTYTLNRYGKARLAVHYTPKVPHATTSFVYVLDMPGWEEYAAVLITVKILKQQELYEKMATWEEKADE